MRRVAWNLGRIPKIVFRCRDTEKIYHREHSRKFHNIEKVALRRSIALDAADSLADLAGPGLSLETLKDDRKGQHSIRISGQYQVCFIWKDRDAHDVEIVDFH